MGSRESGREIGLAELEAWVAKLGAMDPESIRRFLAAEGVRGTRGSAWSCPLAGFLSAKCGMRVSVDVVIIAHGIIPALSDITLPTPESLEWFIDGFDDGDYPELVMPALEPEE